MKQPKYLTISGTIYPIAFRNAARSFWRCSVMPFHSGRSTLSNASMPYGVAASLQSCERERRHRLHLALVVVQARRDHLDHLLQKR